MPADQTSQAGTLVRVIDTDDVPVVAFESVEALQRDETDAYTLVLRPPAAFVVKNEALQDRFGPHVQLRGDQDALLALRAAIDEVSRPSELHSAH